jgi:hypothetical protein
MIVKIILLALLFWYLYYLVKEYKKGKNLLFHLAQISYIKSIIYFYKEQDDGGGMTMGCFILGGFLLGGIFFDKIISYSHPDFSLESVLEVELLIISFLICFILAAIIIYIAHLLILGYKANEGKK